MKTRRSWLLTLGVAVCLSLLFALPVFAVSYPEEDEIAQGVYVGELSLGGMTLAEAEEAVDAYIAQVQAFVVTITVDLDSENPASVAEDGLSTSRMEVTLGELGLVCTNREILTGVTEIGKEGSLITRYKALKDLENDNLVYELTFDWDEQAVLAYITEAAEAFTVSPVDATITKTEDGFVVTASSVGQEVNVEATTAQLLKSFLEWDLSSGITLAAQVLAVQPEISDTALLTITDKLGEATTYYSGDDTTGRNTNLALGTQLINGSVVMPGETFSANAAMEPYTEELGWAYAGSYTADGQVEQTLGGGICQISSTFYNAALYAELTIAQRNAHSMSVSYLPLGLDAAIAGTWKDLKITNNYDTPIYIECYAVGGVLYFAIWGQETRASNRTISFESVTLSSWTAETVYQEDSSLAAGTQEVVYSGHTGYTSIVYKHVYIDGVEVETTVVSEDSYNASSPIIAIGTG